LWLLAAVASAEVSRAHPAMVLNAKWSVGAVAMTLALGAIFYVSAYRPSLTATAALRRGDAELERGHARAAAEEFLTATRADPYGAEAWRNLALLYGQEWAHTGSPQSLKAFEEAVAQVVARDSASFSLWKMIGDLYLNGYRRAPQRAYLEASLNAYRKAVARYPNSETRTSTRNCPRRPLRPAPRRTILNTWRKNFVNWKHRRTSRRRPDFSDFPTLAF
jgi:hypothetical protein